MTVTDKPKTESMSDMSGPKTRDEIAERFVLRQMMEPLQIPASRTQPWIEAVRAALDEARQRARTAELEGLLAEAEAAVERLRDALDHGIDVLGRFRSYYITDNRLGLDPTQNAEARLADDTLALMREASAIRSSREPKR